MATPVLPDIARDRRSRLAERPRVLEAKFGDGYVQRAADGIHHIERTFEAVWRGIPLADLDTLVAFFRERGGVEAFEFTLPGETAARLWRCERWREQRVSASRANLTATLVEAHVP